MTFYFGTLRIFGCHVQAIQSAYSKKKPKIEKILSFIADNFFRILIFEFVLFLSFFILLKNFDENDFDKKEVLGIINSVASIIVAIIVTYLFSKLFAEKSVRIERKKEIDELSLKITYLRCIAYQIRGLHEFWKFRTSNIKSAVDHMHPNLMYEEYRGYETLGIRKFTSEELEKLNKEIHGTSGQAYLALKGLEDGENDFSFYREVNPKNYSLDDIARYKEYAGSFWYLLDRSDDEIVNFNGIHEYWLSSINELYFKIMGKQIEEEKYKSQIKELFAEFDSVFFEKHYYLTSLNSNVFPIAFKISFFNMLIFVIILISSLFSFVIKTDKNISEILTLLLLSMFIANTIDLVTLTIKSIKNELEISEIFKI